MMFFDSQRRFIFCFDPDSGSRLQDLISPVVVSQGKYSSPACPGSFLSCHEENGPDSKSGWDVDPDKPVWSTFCREDVTDPSFCVLFCGFRPRFHYFCNRPTLLGQFQWNTPINVRSSVVNICKTRNFVKSLYIAPLLNYDLQN